MIDKSIDQVTLFQVALGNCYSTRPGMDNYNTRDRPIIYIYMRARVSREGYPVSMVPGQGWSHPAAAMAAAAAAEPAEPAAAATAAAPAG